MLSKFSQPVGERIGYLGPTGSFSHLMCLKHFPNNEHVKFGDFRTMLDGLSSGDCNFAVLPFYNTNNSNVIDAQKELIPTSGKVFANHLLALNVEHFLCGFGRLEDIQVILTKKPVWRQVSKWKGQYAPNAEFQDCESTSLAVERVLELEDSSLAAIASREAAEERGVPIIAERIENTPNTTLFFVLTRNQPELKRSQNALLVIKIGGDSLGQVAAIIEQEGCEMSAASRFSIDGEPYCFVEISAGYANLNLVTCVNQVTEQIKGVSLIGAYCASIDEMI